MTDRRLVPADELAGRLAAVLAAVPRGSVLVQVREKDLDGGPLLEVVRDVARVARPAGARVWVNERVDVALAAAADGVDGVHLAERGMDPTTAKRIAPQLAIGCSRHGVSDVIQAARIRSGVLERIQLGPIHATPSKAGVIEPLGEAVLAVRNRLGAEIALVAIGGIDGPDRARAAVRAGADAVAVIRAVWTARDPGAAAAAIVEAVEETLRSRAK